MSNDINVGAISEALNEKMDRNGKNAASPCSIIIESWVDPEKPTDGYRIWSDGYCEQWGYTTITSGNSYTKISFVKKFISANYRVILSQTGGTADASSYSFAGCCSGSLAKDSFYIRNTASYNTIQFWEASGYLEEGEY